MKYIVSLDKLNKLDFYKENNIDTFIVGLKDYSLNYLECTMEEIEALSFKCDLFVSINKNIFNNELTDLKNKLIALSKLNIKGVLFYDISILSIVKNNNLNIPLCWHQQHMVTNYNTCNYYYNKGCKYVYTANEITLESIIEINKKTDANLMVLVLGYPIISHSRRSLITNYFKANNKEKEKSIYNLTNKDTKLMIKETNNGTSIIYNKIINGIKPLFSLIDNNIEYAVLDFNYLEEDLIKELLVLFNKALIKDINREEVINSVNNLIGDNTNFFYKKTIYKVKGE